MTQPAAPTSPKETVPATGQGAAAPVVRKPNILTENTEGHTFASNHDIKKEVNPFTEADWRMKVFAYAGLIVRIFIIAGAIFSIYQYLETSEEKRLNRTYELLEEWEKPEFQTAQVALRDRLAALVRANPANLGDDPSPQQLAIYTGATGMTALTPEGGAMPLPEFKAHFDRIVSFLNRVSTCVQGRQCSREVTDDYFRDFAVSFWSYFGKYSKQMRQMGSTTYSAPLEEFVTGKRPELSGGVAPTKK